MTRANGWRVGVLIASLITVTTATGRAQFFVDFDDWTTTCPMFSTECDIAVIVSDASANLQTDPECYYGQCLHLRWRMNNAAGLMGPRVSPVWSSVYFEARVRLPPEGSMWAPLASDFIPLAVMREEETGLTYRVGLSGPDLLVVEHTVPSASGDAPPLTVGLPITGAWTRVAVLISEVDATQARVTMWVGDGDSRTSEFVPHRTDGVDVTFSTFDRIYALGAFTSIDTIEKEVYLDDVCFADSVSARTGFCPMQAGVAPDAGAGDAGVSDTGVAVDAAADVGPDAPPPDTGVPRDSGRGDQLSFRGGGGCECSLAEGRPSPGPLAFFAALLAFAITRRRR
jgi:MYXO-CTERM domain-containing protein